MYRTLFFVALYLFVWSGFAVFYSLPRATIVEFSCADADADEWETEKRVEPPQTPRRKPRTESWLRKYREIQPNFFSRHLRRQAKLLARARAAPRELFKKIVIILQADDALLKPQSQNIANARRVFFGPEAPQRPKIFRLESGFATSGWRKLTGRLFAASSFTLDCTTLFDIPPSCVRYSLHVRLPPVTLGNASVFHFSHKGLDALVRAMPSVLDPTPSLGYTDSTVHDISSSMVSGEAAIQPGVALELPSHLIEDEQSYFMSGTADAGTLVLTTESPQPLDHDAGDIAYKLISYRYHEGDAGSTATVQETLEPDSLLDAEFNACLAYTAIEVGKAELDPHGNTTSPLDKMKPVAVASTYLRC